MATDSRPSQHLLPSYCVGMLKSLKIAHGVDKMSGGVDLDPTIGLISHIIDCLGCLRDVNKVYRSKGSLAARSVGARVMFGFTAELGKFILLYNNNNITCASIIPHLLHSFNRKFVTRCNNI